MIKKNSISIIGMSGAGKTTIGKELAKKLKMNFFDMDTYIEEKENKKIIEIFQNGEDYFRKLEKNALKEIFFKNIPSVISTGGGIIKDEENISVLKENSIVIFLDRNLNDILINLDVSNRPLLKTSTEENLKKMYSERYEIYKKTSDYRIKNVGTIENIVNAIIGVLKKDGYKN